MARNKKKTPINMETTSTVDHGRGEIKDNALAALVTSRLFVTRTEKPKKGKGSFKREKFKYKGREPYSIFTFA